MSTVLKYILDVMTDSSGISHPRMNLFLMKSPLNLASVLTVYLASVYYGPRLMRSRKPLSLRYVIIGYNILQIIFNLIILKEIVSYAIDQNLAICVMCIPSAKSDSLTDQAQIRGHYHYILLKYFDLIETVFYILRKKSRQISFLHVSHHVGILLCAWISGKYFPGGQAIFVGLYNTFVHSIMYCYYLYTSLHHSGNLWWKKYITILQLVQHCLVFICFFPVTVNKNCSYPKLLSSVFLCLHACLIYLFVKFYKDNYSTKRKNV